MSLDHPLRSIRLLQMDKMCKDRLQDKINVDHITCEEINKDVYKICMFSLVQEKIY